MEEIEIGGTLIWYYYICRREVWLMGHSIIPDQENDNIIIGKTIDETSYVREKKQINVGHSKIDVLHMENGKIVIGEVKKSSRYRQSARMQLAFYLANLRERGIEAEGELRFPKEKLRETVVLDDITQTELEFIQNEIKNIMALPRPLPPEKQKNCANCAYAEYCWC